MDASEILRVVFWIIAMTAAISYQFYDREKTGVKERRIFSGICIVCGLFYGIETDSWWQAHVLWAVCLVVSLIFYFIFEMHKNLIKKGEGDIVRKNRNA